MRIAIISEDGLPDIRVEKMINTLSKISDDIHFIGKFKGFSGIKFVSQPIIHNIEWNKRANLLIPPYFPKLKKVVLKKINEVRPDLIIAVNLVSAYVSLESGVPVILDYHEVFSEMLNEINPRSLYKKLGLLLRKRAYYNLEKMLSFISFITISYEAASYFQRKYNNDNFIVVKNFPSIVEIEKCKFRFLECKNRKKFLYIGEDLTKYDGRKYRDLRKTVAVFDQFWKKRKDFQIILIGSSSKIRKYIYPKGRVKHIDIYKFANEAHFGILTYYPNRIQKYFSPNKVYIYGHMASIPIITNSLKEVVRDLNGHALIVESNNFEQSLKETLEYALDLGCDQLNETRLKLFHYARSNLVWEKFDDRIISFVKKVMQKSL